MATSPLDIKTLVAALGIGAASGTGAGFLGGTGAVEAELAQVERRVDQVERDEAVHGTKLDHLEEGQREIKKSVKDAREEQQDMHRILRDLDVERRARSGEE